MKVAVSGRGAGVSLATQMEAEFVRLRAADVPYLVVAGDEPGEDYRRWLNGKLPRARLQVWPGSGHFPHLAHPERFAAALAATGEWRLRGARRGDQETVAS